MKIIKFFAGAFAVLISLLIILSIAGYLLLYDSFSDFKADFQFAKRHLRLELFNRGYLEDLSQDDIRYVYQSKCYRRCHGEAAMITAVLSPAGWFQVVERMRVKENVEISGWEVDVIIRYLEQVYPTTKSRFSYEVRKKVHSAVWRNDLGHGDIYTDVIYVTPEYLHSIGAEHLIDEYNLENFHVFITSFSVHDGEVEMFDLDKVAYMKVSNGEVPSTPPWELRFQTADKHHFESIVRFSKQNDSLDTGKGSKKFEFFIKNVGEVDKRVFEWLLPLDYPAEVSALER